MWKYCLFLLAIIAVIFAVPGCNDTDTLQVMLDEEFMLSPGQTAVVAGENLQLQFKDVTEDSRCPADATCIWEGQAVCDVEITLDGDVSMLTLIQPGLSDEYIMQIYNGYMLSFKLTPYPESEQTISSEMYRLHIVISKLPELTTLAGSIIAEPADYAEQSVTITGYYRGWDLLDETGVTPPVTRSDWVIKDSTGALYVSAGSDSMVPEGLNPSSPDDTGAILEVTGIVHLTGEGDPFIQATGIKRLF
jgi:hypothetical protein